MPLGPAIPGFPLDPCGPFIKLKIASVGEKLVSVNAKCVSIVVPEIKLAIPLYVPDVTTSPFPLNVKKLRLVGQVPSSIRSPAAKMVSPLISNLEELPVSSKLASNIPLEFVNFKAIFIIVFFIYHSLQT